MPENLCSTNHVSYVSSEGFAAGRETLHPAESQVLTSCPNSTWGPADFLMLKRGQPLRVEKAARGADSGHLNLRTGSPHASAVGHAASRPVK